MDDPEVIRKAAEAAGVDPATARDVLEAAEHERQDEALTKAREALAPPPGAGRTGFFPSFRRHAA